MGKILDAFANNELYTVEIIEKRSPKRQKLVGKSQKFYNKLIQKCNEEEKEILEQLLDAVYDESLCCAQENFVRGYCLGVMMITEVFSEKDTFLENQQKKFLLTIFLNCR